MSGTDERLSFKEKAGYACGDFASNLFWMTMVFFQGPFYTDVFGLAPAAAAVMFLFGRWWDAISFPIMGMIADRTSTRWGKYRPYLVWLAVPFGVTGVLLFTTPSFSEHGKLVYAWVTFAVFGTVYAAINIPYSSLMGVISPSSEERTSVSSYRFVGAYVGGLFVQLATLKLVDKFGGVTEHAEQVAAGLGTLSAEVRQHIQSHQQHGYQLTMTLYAVVAVALFLVTFFATKERVLPQPGQQTSLKKDLGDIVSNGPWMMLAVVGIFTLAYVSIRNGSVIYYFKYYVKDTRTFLGLDVTSWFLVTGAVAPILGSAVTGPVAKRVGKKLLYVLLMGGSAILTILFYWADRAQLGYMFTLQFFINFLMGPTSPLVFAMFTDTADYSEWKKGRRSTGLVLSAGSFAQSMGWVIGGFVYMQLLAVFGYRANQQQNAATLAGLRLLMSLVPAVGAVLSAVLMIFDKLDTKFMKQVSTELAERRAAQPDPAAT
jgi:glycoside/pentoside/hexuronide:cation symporter, GPH family